jgi:hypothetical protein
MIIGSPLARQSDNRTDRMSGSASSTPSCSRRSSSMRTRIAGKSSAARASHLFLLCRVHYSLGQSLSRRRAGSDPGRVSVEGKPAVSHVLGVRGNKAGRPARITPRDLCRVVNPRRQPVAGYGLTSHCIGTHRMISPYLNRPLLPLAVALPRMLEKMKRLKRNSRTRSWKPHRSGTCADAPN